MVPEPRAACQSQVKSSLACHAVLRTPVQPSRPPTAHATPPRPVPPHLVPWDPKSSRGTPPRPVPPHLVPWDPTSSHGTPVGLPVGPRGTPWDPPGNPCEPPPPTRQVCAKPPSSKMQPQDWILGTVLRYVSASSKVLDSTRLGLI